MNTACDKAVFRYGAILALILLAACIAYLAAVDMLGIETEVMRDRYWKNAYPLFHGDVPVMEYPPFALVFFAIPGFFADGPWSYNIAYVAEMYVFAVVGLYLINRLAEDTGLDPRRAMALYTMLTILLIEFVADRYDIVPMIITLASLVMFVEKRHMWAFALLAVGMLTKLYPAVIVPIYLIYMMGGSDTKGALKGATVFALTSLAIVAVFLIVRPETMTEFVGYHSGRPIQIEAVAASVLYPLSAIGLFDAHIQLIWESRSGSDNLVGPFPDAVAGALVPLMVLTIVVLYAVCFFRRQRFASGGNRALVLAISLALLLFLAVNKVLSAQYLIWLIPFLVFLIMESDRSEGSRRLGILSVAMCLLTQLYFAYNTGWCGGDINGLGMTLILVRNIALLATVCLVARDFRSIMSPVAGARPVSGRV